MTRAIVITTIHPPTDAVLAYARRVGTALVVVGDRKTPEGWSLPGVRFIAAAEQPSLGRLGRELPWDHYSRKMLGYVEAARGGASAIVDTDDDNAPKPDWDFPPFDGEEATTPDDLGFINVYALFSEDPPWPRGLPLARVTDPSARPGRDRLRRSRNAVAVWQGLVDGDPDVDAIYRLTVARERRFDDGPPVVLGAGTLTPVNSQNTAFRREALALMYLPATVTFRFTDILRGWVAQPILWKHGWRVGVSRASVVQVRNPHDLMADFRSELPCYLEGPRVPELVLASLRAGASLEEDLLAAYGALARAGIVSDRELSLVEAWLEDLRLR